MEELQSWWEVPSIAHFCFVFRAAFNLLHFEIEELEDALLQDFIDESNAVQQLVIRLLQGCCETKNITNLNWEDRLRKLLKKKWVGREGRPHPLPEQTSFFTLPLRTKVEILHALCDYRLEAADVNDALKVFEGSSLRVEPVGRDGHGCVYWYFFGMRLYKEVCCTSQRNESEQNKNSKEQEKNLKQNKKKTKEWPRSSKLKATKNDCNSLDENENTPRQKHSRLPWSIVCFSFEDWHVLIKKLQSSRSNLDKQLYRVLEEKFLPNLLQIVAEREKILKKKMLELAPRRTSARIDKIKQQKEEEEKEALKVEEEKRKVLEAEEERRLAEMERKKKDNLIHGRARRAEERSKAIEGRNKRAKLREDRLNNDSSSIESEEIISYTSDSDDYDDSEVQDKYSNSEFEESLSLETSSSSFDENLDEMSVNSESVDVGCEDDDEVISIDDDSDDEVKEEDETITSNMLSVSETKEQIVNGIHTAVGHPSGWHYSNSLTVPCDRRYYSNQEVSQYFYLKTEHSSKPLEKLEFHSGTKNDFPSTCSEVNPV